MDPKITTELQAILAELYPDEISIRRILTDAGINSSRIGFTNSPINIWYAVLTEISLVNRFDDLFNAVVPEYGTNEKFRKIYEIYRHPERELLEILLSKFIESEFRLLVLGLTPNEFKQIMDLTSIEKVVNFIDILTSQGKFDDLIQSIQMVKPDIDLTKWNRRDKPEGTSSPFVVAFVNRAHELSLITQPSSLIAQYLIISAPAGYGKSSLLQEASDYFNNEAWVCKYIKLNREENYTVAKLTSTLLKSIGHNHIGEMSISQHNVRRDCIQFAQYLYKQLEAIRGKGVVVILDEVEALINDGNDDIVKTYMDEIVTTINEGFDTIDYKGPRKFILAGRYVERLQTKATDTVWDSKSLEPFNFRTVYQTVAQLFKKGQRNPRREILLNLASYIMNLTGGHPELMAKLLVEYMETYQVWPVTDYFEDKENKLRICKQVEKFTIKAIQSNIPPELCEAFCILSAVRRFNIKMISELIEDELIHWNGDAFTLEKALMNAYLIERKDGFLYDGITRSLLAITMRGSEDNLFKYLKVCKKTCEYYKRSLLDPGILRPDIVTTEIFYQEMQIMYYEKSSSCSQFLETVHPTLELLIKDRPKLDIIQSLLDLLHNDWELRFCFNFYWKDGNFDEVKPYAKLIEEVTEFKKQVKSNVQ